MANFTFTEGRTDFPIQRIGTVKARILARNQGMATLDSLEVVFIGDKILPDEAYYVLGYSKEFGMPLVLDFVDIPLE